MSERIENISVELLVPAFILLRLVDKTALDYIELRDSIAEHGFFDSICVRESKRYLGKYEIIDGYHRYCIAVDCGLKDIPCIIKEASDSDLKNWQMQANLLRRETANCEYATRLKMMFIENPELTMEVLAVKLHCRPGRLQEILRLNQLTPDAKKQLDAGNLPLTSAYALSRMPKRLQEDLISAALDMSASNFVHICNGYRKSYNETLKTGRIQDYLNPEPTPTPHLRTFNQIRCEYNHLVAGRTILETFKSTEPIKIWEAALAWVLHLDEVSINKDHEAALKRVEIEKRNLIRRVNSNKTDHRRHSEARKLGIDTNAPDGQDNVDLFLF